MNDIKSYFFFIFFKKNGPAYEILVLISSVKSECLDEPAPGWRSKLWSAS